MRKKIPLNEYIEKVKRRYRELEHKHWTWKSFYNGALEGFSILLPKIHKLEEQNEALERKLEKLRVICARERAFIDGVGEK